jgi:hypothetical protein
MADDATASATAQDLTFAGEGVTDISALDQGTSLDRACPLLCLVCCSLGACEVVSYRLR